MTEGLIIVDWGSSNLRIYLVDSKGQVLEEHHAATGISSILPSKIIPTLLNSIATWPRVPILCSGMIGSKNGMVETPYLTCPINTNQLAQAILDVSSLLQREAYIVPGVSFHSSGFIDVIRGEETIAIGVHSNDQIMQVCLPGTLSKWLSLQEETILNFQTYPTGELFACIPSSPIFQYSFQKNTPHCEQSFTAGLTQSQQGTSLSQQLFSLRSNYLFTKNWNAHSFLSGLLIGHEVSNACCTDEVLLIANDHLGQRYQSAFQHLLPEVEITVLNEQNTLLQGARTLWERR